MCTIIKLSQKNRPRIATKDIQVYKVGSWINRNDQFTSKYYGHDYVSDQLYTAEFSYSNNDSCSDSTEADYYVKLREKGVKQVFVGQGFHAYVSIDRISREYGFKPINLGLFVIPKGAEYYLNGAGNIVSNQIIFKEYITCA